MHSCGGVFIWQSKASVGDSEIMGRTKFQASLSVLVDFTSTVFIDYILPDNVILSQYSIKVSRENGFIVTWNSLKNAIECVVKSILTLNTTCYQDAERHESFVNSSRRFGEMSVETGVDGQFYTMDAGSVHIRSFPQYDVALAKFSRSIFKSAYNISE